MLVVGATAVVRHARKGKGRNATSWLVGLIERKKPKPVVNKMAHIAWKLMVTGEQ